MVDWVDKRFGTLTVISLVEKKSTKGCDHIWECKCDCGQIVNRTSSALRKRKCSCGCGRRGTKHHGYTGCGTFYGQTWRALRCGAKKRNIKCDLTIEDIWDQYLKQNKKCALTGLYIEFGKGISKTASVDRKNSELGYTKENIHIVHKNINLMKNILSIDDFLNWCKLVVLNMKLLN